MPNQGKHWEPSPETFEKFLRLLSADREQSGESYELLRLKLSTFFARRCHPDPARLADDVLDRFMRKVEDGEVVGAPLPYAFGIARFLEKEAQRKEKQEGTSLDELDDDELADLPPVSFDSLEVEESRAHLKHCLATLTQDDRFLFVAYYCQDEAKNKDFRKELAKKYGLSPLALRLRVLRLKAHLKDCMSKAMKPEQKK